MTSTTTNLGLTLYNSTTDQSGSFLTWQQDMSGSGNSNMRKIDNWSGSASGSMTALNSSISGSITTITTNFNNVSGSMATIMSDINSLGLRWQKIGEFNGAGQADFNNISGSYTHLLLVGVAGISYAAMNADLAIDFNGDANSSNYNTLQWGNFYPSSEFLSTYVVGSIVVANVFGSNYANYGAPFFALIPNYSVSGSFYKTAMGISAFAKISPNINSISTALQGGVWSNSDAITRVRVFGVVSDPTRRSFVAGTKISLYGIG